MRFQTKGRQTIPLAGPQMSTIFIFPMKILFARYEYILVGNGRFELILAGLWDEFQETTNICVISCHVHSFIYGIFSRVSKIRSFTPHPKNGPDNKMAAQPEEQSHRLGKERIKR